MDAKSYQKEQMADQPLNRKQTPKTNAATDAKDYGKIKGNVGTPLLNGEGMPTLKVKNPGQYFPK